MPASLSPDRIIDRLDRVREGVDTACHLAEAGCMAVQALDETEREALAELLNAIQDKLREASDSLTQTMRVTS